MELDKGINRARQLANLKNQKDTEFYEELVNWLEELREFRNHAHDDMVFHGMSDTRIYHIWAMMKSRCYNANSENYKYYGGKGVSVCEEWKNKHGFWNFYNWAIRNGYQEDLSIDRIDPCGNYEPNNCRWVSNDIQANNKRKDGNKTYAKREKMKISYKGKTMSPREWGDHLGISEYVIRQRLKKGWSVEKTLETPLQVDHRREGAGRKSKRG